MQGVADARWDDVRIFLEAHRQKSLGAAASRLGIDTSTVSRRITALEASLGVRLFERTREGLLPARGAERVLAAAESMEAAHGRLKRDASDVEAQAEGIVRLSADPGMAELFIAPALVRLRAKYPKVHIELDASAQPRDLTRHEADLALRSVQPRGAELVTTKLLTAKWLPASAPALVEEIGRVSSWNDPPWLAWDKDFASFAPARWVTANAGKAEIVLRTSHFSAQLAAAEAGLGVALLPTMFIRARRLEEVRYTKTLASSIHACPSSDVWLVGHRILRDVPRVAAVWSFFADELRAVTEAA
ncbi:Transcriptional regulator, LysR family [Labilithrix luteola]|uniref:Transcriptional regulator, LysR family n=1 Tax=Labilithrix luteola TaxID=1391654 RepID=A0A0K1PR85_9BACT|nr:Transcriptional regulator, LysR family [Labilithrix luteola]